MKERRFGATPYAPIRDLKRATDPYICRVVPGENLLMFEWLDKGCGDSGHTVYWKVRESDAEYMSAPICDNTVTLEGLLPRTEYSFYIARNDGSAKSNVRLLYTCDTEGTIINYNHPEDDNYAFSGHYLSSPGIIKLPSGGLLVSHDVFSNGPGQGLSILYRSDDGGRTWHFLTELYPLFWPKFFIHNDKIYALGVARECGDLIISVSEDEGVTFSEPTVLLHGDNGNEAGLHQNCTPVITHNGRIYTGMESGSWKLWNDKAFGCTMISAPDDCDLTVKENWDFTPLAFLDPKEAGFPDAEFITAIEGNAVVGPDGEIYDILRVDPVNCKRPANAAVMMHYKNPDEPLEFVRMLDVKTGVRHKFYTLCDEQTGLYFMLHNEETDENQGRRSTISLSVSEDLVNWQKLTTLLDCTATPRAAYSYPSFCIDGDDLLFVSRTAFGLLKSEHDNNCITFHRLEKFRDLLNK